MRPILLKMRRDEAPESWMEVQTTNLEPTMGIFRGSRGRTDIYSID